MRTDGDVGQSPASRRGSAPVDVSAASPARVYDYWLGGKDNFAADRRVAEEIAAKTPEVREVVRANRAFLVRAVRQLAAAGVRQYVDLGSGLPTSPSVHEIARLTHTDARVAYVDNDPVVAAHGRAFNAVEATAIVQADLRTPDDVFAHPDLADLIDFREPVAVLAVAVLHFLDDHDSIRMVSRFREVMVPGSFLVVSHASPGGRTDREVREAAETYATSTAPVWVRTPDQIRCYFTGLGLVEPGLVAVQDWRPGAAPTVRVGRAGEPPRPEGVFLAGVARVPGGGDV